MQDNTSTKQNGYCQDRVEILLNLIFEHVALGTACDRCCIIWPWQPNVLLKYRSEPQASVPCSTSLLSWTLLVSAVVHCQEDNKASTEQKRDHQSVSAGTEVGP